MSKSIKWGRSEDGYVDSKCGLFRIVPKWWGRVSPQEYVVEHRVEETWTRIESADTQRDAKRRAQNWVIVKSVL